MERLIAGQGATNRRVADLAHQRQLAEERGPAPLHALSKYLQPPEGKGGEGLPVVLTLPHQRARLAAASVDPQSAGIYTSFGGSNAYVPANGFFLCSFARVFSEVAATLPRMNYSSHFPASAEVAVAAEEAAKAKKAAAQQSQQQQQQKSGGGGGNSPREESPLSETFTAAAASASASASASLPLTPSSPAGPAPPQPQPPNGGRRGTLAPVPPPSPIPTDGTNEVTSPRRPSYHSAASATAGLPRSGGGGGANTANGGRVGGRSAAVGTTTAAAGNSGNSGSGGGLGTAAFARSHHDQELVEWYTFISAVRTYAGPVDATATAAAAAAIAAERAATAVPQQQQLPIVLPAAVTRPFMSDLLFRPVAELEALAAATAQL